MLSQEFFRVSRDLLDWGATKRVKERIKRVKETKVRPIRPKECQEICVVPVRTECLKGG